MMMQMKMIKRRNYDVKHSPLFSWPCSCPGRGHYGFLADPSFRMLQPPSDCRPAYFQSKSWEKRSQPSIFKVRENRLWAQNLLKWTRTLEFFEIFPKKWSFLTIFLKKKLAFVNDPGFIKNHFQVSFGQLLLIFWGSEGDLSNFEKFRKFDWNCVGRLVRGIIWSPGRCRCPGTWSF